MSSSAQDSPGALPRFPGSRLRSNHKPHPPGSNPSSPSLNSSTDTCYSVSPGTSISSTHLDSSSQSRDCPLTPEPPRSASYLTPDRPPVGLGGRGRGGAARFLSRSNPPPTERVGGKQSGGGGKGGISIPPLRITANRHSLISLEAADTTKTGSRAPLLRGGGGGGREGLPLFLQKFEPSSSRIPPMLSVAGRSKEILPQSSWRVTGGQKNLKTEKLKLQEVPPTRRRSFTVPAKAPPKSRPGWEIITSNAVQGKSFMLFVGCLFCHTNSPHLLVKINIAICLEPRILCKFFAQNRSAVYTCCYTETFCNVSVFYRTAGSSGALFTRRILQHIRRTRG